MVVNTSPEPTCRSDLEAVLTEVLKNISSHESHQSEPNSEREVLDVFLNAANLTTDDTKGAEGCMSFEEFRSWCARLPSVRKFLGTLLSPRDSGFCFTVILCLILLHFHIFLVICSFSKRNVFSTYWTLHPGWISVDLNFTFSIEFTLLLYSLKLLGDMHDTGFSM